MQFKTENEQNSVSQHLGCSTVQKEENIFLLEPMRRDNKGVERVSLVFSSSIKQQGKGNGNLPKFNRDGLYHTPSFITEFSKFSQKTSFQSQEQKIIETHNQVYVSRPTSTFCQVCRVKYVDYLKHIDTLYHKSQVQKSPFQKQIKKFIEEFSILSERFQFANKKVKRSFESNYQ